MSAVFVCLPEERDKWLAARRAGISASEIAAVLGISPWDSPFNLFWAKTLGWDTDENELMRIGSHLEQTIADWWAGNHPHEVVCPGGLYASKDRPWQLATPDRLVCDPQMHDNPFPDDPNYRYDHLTDAFHQGLLECKWVSYSWDGWGEPGTDEIPTHYRAQVQQQMDVMEVDRTYIAALGPGGFRHYEVARDETDIATLRKAGAAFMAGLVHGDPPDLDSHDATLAAVKRLHPDLEDIEVEVSIEVADEYLMRVEDYRYIQARMREAEIKLRAAMGNAKRAVCEGDRVATRVISDIPESTITRAAHRRDYLIAPKAKEPKT